MVRVRVAAPLSMSFYWVAVGCFFIMVGFLFPCWCCSLVDVFYCSTNTATLSTRVDKIAVLLVTLSPIPPHCRGDCCGGTSTEKATAVRVPRCRLQQKAMPFSAIYRVAVDRQRP